MSGMVRECKEMCDRDRMNMLQRALDNKKIATFNLVAQRKKYEDCCDAVDRWRRIIGLTQAEGVTDETGDTAERRRV